MELFTWERKVLFNTSSFLSIQFMSNQSAFSSLKENTGRLNLTLSTSVKEGYGAWLPHLAHSHRTSELDIQLDGLHTGSNFTNGRFALRLNIASSNPKGKFYRRQTESLNDEHTPGIFKTNELLFPGRNESAYIQWRPIVYTKAHRGLADSTGVEMSRGRTLTDKKKAFRDSSLYALYGQQVEEFSTRYYYVTFGAPKDGFYNKTKYNAW
ncbi:Lysosomal protein NCUG1Alike [Caligus rogercresseyi]|uniref:Lysosomal protein NCUG1Alike n=1 Tax=Caligus rogercresseyi TaxID=217165 RepID=A0A7T8QSS6_CALRO|nr:Lysosomal protein NCUG1Alike [Caligus rogercresseyi]